MKYHMEVSGGEVVCQSQQRGPADQSEQTWCFFRHMVSRSPQHFFNTAAQFDEFPFDFMDRGPVFETRSSYRLTVNCEHFRS